MKLVWLTTSGVCVVAAAVLLARGNLDAAFVVATLGVVAWFLNFRRRMKDVIKSADDSENIQEDKSDEVQE